MKQKNSRYVIVALVFIASMFICCFLSIYMTKNQAEVDFARIEQLIDDKGDKLAEVIAIPMYKAYTIASYVVQKNGQNIDFQRLAAEIIDNPDIKNVLIAPDGVVSDVYPMEGNENLIGSDLLTDSEGKKAASLAIELRQMVCTGPINLIEGGQGIVGRLPVIMADENGDMQVWGLVVVTVNYPDILRETNLESLDEQGLSYELWCNDSDTGEKMIIAGRDLSNESYLEKPLEIMNGTWFLRIASVKAWYTRTDFWALIVLGFIISLLLASIVHKNKSLNIMKHELEEMVQRDGLTNLLNRKGLIFELERLIRMKKGFLLYFIDINKFKSVNDNYGHHVGDFVLSSFSQRIDKYLDGSHIFARISGDEFVLVHVDENVDAKRMDAFWAKLNKEFETPIYENEDEKVYLSFSKGLGIYPKDGTTIDEVMAKADENMYQEKNGHKKGCSC